MPPQDSPPQGTSFEHTVIVKGIPPGQPHEVIFAPVRGDITGIARTDPPSVRAVLAGPSAVRVRVPADLAGGTDVSLTLVVCGEPPGQYSIRPAPAQGPLKTLEVLGPRDWEPLYRARQNLVNDHAFMFELDRTTNARLLPYMPADEISDDERAARIADMDPRDPNSFIARLVARLRARMTTDNPRFDPINPDTSIRRFSTAFRAAAAKHNAGDRWELVGDSLLRFAAGHTMQNVLIPTKDWNESPIVKSVLVGGPDSFFIFLFAEMAFCALELDNPPDRDMWEALLPYLVDMQRVYTSRFTDDRPKRLTDYAGMREISAEPPTLLVARGPVSDLAGAMGRNLRAAADSYA